MIYRAPIPKLSKMRISRKIIIKRSITQHQSMRIKKAVIAAAGLGTRMLSVTKETPKEMLPLYTVDGEAFLGLKPVLQLIFEQLYDFGIRDFCFIVGRGKRAIEDHFTPDYSYNE